MTDLRLIVKNTKRQTEGEILIEPVCGDCKMECELEKVDDYHLCFELGLALATVAGREDEGGVL